MIGVLVIAVGQVQAGSGPTQWLVGATVGPSPGKKPLVSNYQWQTISGPAQRLVGAPVGPSPSCVEKQLELGLRGDDFLRC